MTMGMRNTKWLWNPGKQSKVGRIFSHMQPNYHSESGSKEKMCAPLLCKLTKCHLNYLHFANLHKNGK